MAMLALSCSGSSIAASSTLTGHLGVQCAAQQAITLDEVDGGFDGTNSANGPGLVSIVQDSFATNPPGTNSTLVTLAKTDSGRPETIQSVGGRTWTAESTVKTIVKNMVIPTYMGGVIAPLPLMKPIIAKGGGGVLLQSTLPSAVTANWSGSLFCTE